MGVPNWVPTNQTTKTCAKGTSTPNRNTTSDTTKTTTKTITNAVYEASWAAGAALAAAARVAELEPLREAIAQFAAVAEDSAAGKAALKQARARRDELTEAQRRESKRQRQEAGRASAGGTSHCRN